MRTIEKARFDTRLPKEQKDFFEFAANLGGFRTLTEFVIVSVQEKAKEIVDLLKLDFNLQYDDKDAIGRRYRRQDAIGTPICVTVDNETLEDNCVTIRYRDSMKQERIPIAQLHEAVRLATSLNQYFK